jgi:hypothetical protein
MVLCKNHAGKLSSNVLKIAVKQQTIVAELLKADNNLGSQITMGELPQLCNFISRL